MKKFIELLLEPLLLITGVFTFVHSMVKSYNHSDEWFHYAAVAVLCFGIVIISNKLDKNN